MLELKKAVREQIVLKLALIGPSGSGKTYSALTLARGMGLPALLIDTEKGRGKVYADEFDYYYHEMQPPYSPEAYIELIKAAEKTEAKVLIIDGMFHEWDFLLKVVDSMTQVKNEYARWGK